MANNDRDLEFLAQQLEELEEKAALLERQKEEAEDLLSQVRNNAAADEAAREALLEETSRAYMELEGQLKEYITRYNEVSRKLEAAQQADDYRYNVQTYRTQRKLNEHYQKQIKEAKAEMKQFRASTEAEKAAAARELAAVREEVRVSQDECNNAIRQIDVYTRVFNDVIFPRFAKHYKALENQDANTIDPVKLQTVVACAKRRDTEYEKELNKYFKLQKQGKQAAEPQRSETAYSSIVDGIVEEYLSLREEYARTPIGKQKLDEFDHKLESTLGRHESIDTPEGVVAKILNDQSQAHVKSIAKSKKGVTLISSVLAVVIGLGVLAGSAFGIYKATHKDLQDTTANLGEATQQVQVLDEELADKVDGIISQGSIDGAYETIGVHVNSTESIQTMFATEEAVEAQEAKTGKEVSVSGIDAAVQKAQEAQEKADALYETKDEVLNGYKEALKTNDYEAINTEAKKVNNLSTEMQAIKGQAAEAVAEALDAVNLEVQDLKNISDLIRNPYSSVDFGADAATKYNDVLINHGKGGTLVGIVSNEYVKSTGDVTVLAECQDAFGRSYFNLFEYQIAPNIHVLGAEQMLAPVLNGENVSMNSFDKDLVTNVEGENTQMSTNKGDVEGETSIKYNITASYSTQKKQTTVTASALITVTDAEGKVSTKVVSVTEKYQGQIKVSDVESAMKKEIVKKVAAVVDREVSLDIEEDVVNEP